MTVQYQPLRITSPMGHVTITSTIFVFLKILAMSFLVRSEVAARGHGRHMVAGLPFVRIVSGRMSIP